MKTLIIIASFVVAPALAQDAPPVLRNNPFSRPPSDVIIDDRVSVRSEETANATIELQATMIGSINRLANVGGQIFETGDEVQGYVIAEIQEQYVVFERDGRALTVHVKPLQADDRNREDTLDRQTSGRRR